MTVSKLYDLDLDNIQETVDPKKGSTIKASTNIFAALDKVFNLDPWIPQIPSPLNLGDLEIGIDEDKLREEEEIRRLTLKKLRADEEAASGSLKYDTVDSTISLKGKNIEIPQDTNQELLCKVILRNRKAMIKKWSWDEAVEEWGDNPDEVGWRKVYTAGRAINEKVAIETGIKNLLIVKTKFVQLNPKILP